MSKKKRIHSDVVRDSINTFGTNAIGAVLMLIASFVVLRKVKPEIRGYYTVVQQWGSGFYTVFSLSIAASFIYFVARYKIKNTKSSILRLSAITFFFILLIGSVILLVLRNSSFFCTTPVDFLVATVVYALCSLVLSVCTCILRGENKFKSFNIVNLAQRILLVVLYFVIAVRPSAGLWIWGTNAIMVLMTGFAVYCIYRWSGPRPQPVPEDDHPVGMKSMTAYSLKAHVSNVLTYSNTYLGTYIVQGQFGIKNLGVYNTAFTIMQQVWILPDAVSQVIMSRIAAMSEKKDKLHLTLISAKVVFYITALTTILIYVFAKLLLPWLFPMYTGALEPLAYLLVGAILISYAKVLGNSIAAYGRPELNIVPTVTGIAANAVACILLIPSMHINGVALATSISLAVQSITCIAIFCHFSHTPFYRLIVPTKEEINSMKGIFKK